MQRSISVEVPFEDRKDLKQLKTPVDSDKTHLFFGLNEQKYVAGSKIDGVIVVVVQCEQLSTKNLLVKWQGNEQCGIESNLLGNKLNDENKTIFLTSTTIWSSDSQKSQRILRRGTHTFPVSWLLPDNIPSSFSTKLSDPKAAEKKPNSEIKYSATAILELEGQSISSNAIFSVVEKFDSSIRRMSPITKEVEKSFFLTKTPLKVRATLTKGGAAFIGYRFPVYIEVTNPSKKKVDSISIMIQQTNSITAQGKLSQWRNNIYEGSIQLSLQEGISNFSRELLVDILHDVPPSVTTATLIQRKYEFTVTVRVAMSPLDLKLAFPIDIFDLSKQNISLSSFFSPIHNTLIIPPSPKPAPHVPTKPVQEIPVDNSTPSGTMTHDNSGQVTTPILSEESSSSSDSSSDELMDIHFTPKLLAEVSTITEQGKLNNIVKE